jgi:hypothetical protein
LHGFTVQIGSGQPHGSLRMLPFSQFVQFFGGYKGHFFLSQTNFLQPHGSVIFSTTVSQALHLGGMLVGHTFLLQ